CARGYCSGSHCSSGFDYW
nr:immunoglobulin heavy chain junction region [Macaca mulatta]MOX58946.1 immunoglobulin heavy chain junction region [Macaca mulatta]MOX61076.1 immunoglobulin heavy chain junction region [Macaca mulatta]MOX61265.1 immunoglobulin heavy chain junction region [Macaca mulatta]MOX61904.1 immunoglobulin heavy chain junction region [Macaca mulatta]